jgi:hypothetical protein
MPKPTPVKTTLAMVVRGAREAGFTLPVIRAWLTEELERNPPPQLAKAWRLVFDEDGRAALITPDGEIGFDDIVMSTSGPPGLHAAPDVIVSDPIGIADPKSASAPQHLEDVEPATTPSKREENEIAIELAAQELRQKPKFKRNELYERLFGSEDKRAPPLKKKSWATNWTPSRFRTKVWKPARERAGLDPIAPKGRHPDE